MPYADVVQRTQGAGQGSDRSVKTYTDCLATIVILIHNRKIKAP